MWVYNVASNSWSAGNPAPEPFLLAGYQQVGNFLYLAGGWTGGVATGLTTVRRLDLSTGVWDAIEEMFPMGRADFGLAYDAFKNKLYALGGDAQGGGFFDSTNEVDELDLTTWAAANTFVVSPPALPLPNRSANQAGFYGLGADLECRRY